MLNPNNTSMLRVAIATFGGLIATFGGLIATFGGLIATFGGLIATNFKIKVAIEMQLIYHLCITNILREIFMKKKLLPKPNQLIAIKGGISTQQRRMYNVMLAKAHRILKESDDDEFSFSFEEIRSIAGISDRNKSRVREALAKIMSIAIEYSDEKDHWGGFNLISQYERVGDVVKIAFPPKIKKALKANNYYTTLDLLTMSNLKGKYSIVLYELISRYKDFNPPRYTIEEFKDFLGIKASSYNNFNLLKNKVIIPSLEEIKEKTDLNIGYEIFKSGRKVVKIQFTSENNLNKFELKEEFKDDKLLEENLKIERAVEKVKKNLYVSKAWNGMVDIKVRRILEEKGIVFTLNLLNELYKNLNQEINTTLVQYINGMLTNKELEESLKKEKKKKRNYEKKEVKVIENVEENNIKPELDHAVELRGKVINWCVKNKKFELLGNLENVKTLAELGKFMANNNVEIEG